MPPNTRQLVRWSREKDITATEALGKLHVLAVGVSQQSKSSKFDPLKQCAFDAEAVARVFKTVPQLNADAARVRHLAQVETSKGGLLGSLIELAESAEAGNRVLFFFSGHGVQLGGKLYLVPSDAWSASTPEALVAFDQVLEILNRSTARQKIVVLDACGSGPDTEGLKFLPAEVSEKFLKEYLGTTTGTAVLASSLNSQASTTQSPNPKLSLFSHYFVEGLSGAPEALDGFFLTMESLFKYLSVKVRRTAKSFHRAQHPVLQQSASGSIVLGDFRAVVTSETFALDKAPVRELAFVEEGSLDVRDVLRSIKKWTYSQEYLERRVNENLGGYLGETLGRLAANVRRETGISAGELFVEGASLTFPGGAYSVEYRADDKKSGTTIHRVTFQEEWFGRGEEIAQMLKALELDPSEMVLELSGTVKPKRLIAGLEAHGWTVTSTLEDRVCASRDDYDIVVEPGTLTFTGFPPGDILGSETDRVKAKLAGGVLALLGSAIRKQ